MTYQCSTPLATREIRIVRSELDDRAGVIGAAIMTIESTSSLPQSTGH